MQANNTLKNNMKPPSNNFFKSAPLNQYTTNFFDTPFEDQDHVEEPKFNTMTDKKKSNVRISFNNHQDITNPSLMLNNETINESLKSNTNIKHELFKDNNPKNKLAVTRDRRDKSFTRPSIQIFKDTPNRSVSNKCQKYQNNIPENGLINNHMENRKSNSHVERISNKSKSIEVNDNFSVVSKNSKSPLNIMVLDEQKKVRSHGSFQSKNSFQDTDDLTNDPIRLKTLLTARDAEIRHLNQKLDELQEIKESRDAFNYDDPQHKHLNSYRIKKLGEELKNLKKENEAIKTENNDLKYQLQKKKNELNQQMFNMKLKFEENARKNMEVMEREVAFKYASDENESIRYMKERIEELEDTLKSYQQNNQ